MKNLQKLKLHNPAEISAQEQGSLKGGGEFVYLDGNWTYLADEVTVYGGSTGMVQNAISEIGVVECAGSECDNPRIQEYLASCDGYNINSPDSTPWCSAFVNFIAQKSGYEGTDSAKASTWLNWGTGTSNPQPGDVAIAPDGHHVGIVKSVEDGIITIISGNYSDQVAESVVSGFTYRSGN